MLLLDILFDYIVKAIKLFYNISKINNYLFAIYNLYYKKKLEMIVESKYNLDLFYKSNYLATYFHINNDNAYITQINLIFLIYTIYTMIHFCFCLSLFLYLFHFF